MLELSALELSAAIKAKKFSVTEAVNAYIESIEKNDSKHNTFITITKEEALVRAKEVQSLIDKGETLSPLAGVPITLKDNISTKGIKTTCASKMLENYTPVFNATVVDKLEQAGMIVVGKLNMDEFSMSGSGDNASAVAVASAIAVGEIPMTLGSDTGGSIRQSSAFCGITGIKPTYGAVSRYGLIANASSLDQIGPMGKNIDDCAALLAIIAGQDNMDGTCVLEKPFEFNAAARERLDGVKICLPENYLQSGVAKEFEAAGASVDSINIEKFGMPLAEHFLPAWYIIACAEAASNLARYDGLKFGYRSTNAKTLNELYRLSRSEGFGAEVKRRIMFGSFVTSSGNYDKYYRKALQVRSLVKNAYAKLFETYDIILSPVTPTVTPKLGENTGLYMGDIFNAPVNLAGLPAIALPCGLDSQGLPIGFQLIGNAFSEAKLIEAARVYQKKTKHHSIIKDNNFAFFASSAVEKDGVLS
ncbi:MAG: aspartyl/glutamyl-tRNA amidotransferase subunit A [Treponema sp.]|jgi:aspartyl-tRNA(Asn)/glutamyl-tRNA(Gln) amidotransferase subunit A|nr:aspartyl/glutamyl-tRNA amidotransferase subunit A [Treponema sp.]